MKTINKINKVNPRKQLFKIKSTFRFLKFKIKSKSNTEPFTYVTAADEQYFSPCLRLINNLKSLDNQSEIFVYDLGLSKSKINEFEKLKNVTVIKFNFNKFPEFLSEKTLPDNKLGNYAWKSVIISEIIDLKDTNIIWFDSACILGNKLNTIKNLTLLNGIFIVKATGIIKDWTHSKTLEIMNAKIYEKKDCVMSGIIGIKKDNELLKSLILDWRNYSLNKDCIAPSGSSRLNHRQDQSIFQILIHKYKFSKFLLNHEHLGIKINQVFDRIFLQDISTKHPLYQLRTKIFESHPTLFTNSIERSLYCILFDTKLLSPNIMNALNKKDSFHINFKDKKENFDSELNGLKNDLEIKYISVGNQQIIKNLDSSTLTFENLVRIRENSLD